MKHRLGAGLAHYALFTIAAFLALTTALVEQLFGLAEVAGYGTDRLEQLGIVDAESAGESIATELRSRSVTSTLGVIGIGPLLFASSLVLVALVDAINTLWNVPVRSGIRNAVRHRLISFLMVLVTGIVLDAELAITTVSGVVGAVLLTLSWVHYEAQILLGGV
jgi:uncharacterized BrkB/YihY/UPF0761 family membrane protein